MSPRRTPQGSGRESGSGQGGVPPHRPPLRPDVVERARADHLDEGQELHARRLLGFDVLNRLLTDVEAARLEGLLSEFPVDALDDALAEVLLSLLGPLDLPVRRGTAE